VIAASWITWTNFITGLLLRTTNFELLLIPSWQTFCRIPLLQCRLRIWTNLLMAWPIGWTVAILRLVLNRTLSYSWHQIFVHVMVFFDYWIFTHSLTVLNYICQNSVAVIIKCVHNISVDFYVNFYLFNAHSNILPSLVSFEM